MENIRFGNYNAWIIVNIEIVLNFSFSGTAENEAKIWLEHLYSTTSKTTIQQVHNFSPYQPHAHNLIAKLTDKEVFWNALTDKEVFWKGIDSKNMRALTYD